MQPFTQDHKGAAAAGKRKCAEQKTSLTRLSQLREQMPVNQITNQLINLEL